MGRYWWFTRAEGLAWALCLAALTLPEVVPPDAFLPPAGQRGFIWLFPLMAWLMAGALRSTAGLLASVFVVLLQWSGAIHHQYFGAYFRKKDIELLGAEFHDMSSGLLGTWEIWRWSALGMVLSLALLLVARQVMRRPSMLRGAGLLLMLCVPLYMGLTMPAWRLEPDSRRPLLVNAMYAWGGFLSDRVVPKAAASAGKWLPYRVQEDPAWVQAYPGTSAGATATATVAGAGRVATAADLAPIAQADPAAKMPVSIVLIIGESLNPDHMGVLGYQRDTTPELSGRVRRFHGGASRIMGAGVSTRVSVPMLVNVVREPGHVKAMGESGSNLFGAAKRHGYQTAFVSVQKMDGLSNLMGGRMLDHWVDAVDRPIPEGPPDADLLARVRQSPIRWDRPFLLALNTRSAHIPYRDNFPASFARFSREAAATPEQATVNDYDDAVRWFDLQVARTVDFIMASATGPVLFLLVSDHGQLVGKHGRIGHNVLHPEVYKTPLIWFANDRAVDGARAVAQACIGSHYHLGRFILRALGWQLHNPNVRPDAPDTYWVNGNDLDGGNGVHRYRMRDVPFHDPRCAAAGEGAPGADVLITKR